MHYGPHNRGRNELLSPRMIITKWPGNEELNRERIHWVRAQSEPVRGGGQRLAYQGLCQWGYPTLCSLGGPSVRALVPERVRVHACRNKKL